MLLSLTVLCATLDYIPPDDRKEHEMYAIITAAISFGISFLVTFGHFIVPVRKVLVGTLGEMIASIIPLSLWMVGTIMIQNPNDWFASTVDDKTGFEDIQYANIFFFSWAVLFSNIYLTSAVFVNNKDYNPDLIIWSLLFSVSFTLCGVAATLKSYICKVDDISTCWRTSLAIGIGAGVGGLTLIALILCGMNKLGPCLHLTIGTVSLVSFVTGVAFITSASGPAVTMSSMYFATWGGAFFSTYAFSRGLAEMFGGSLAGH